MMRVLKAKSLLCAAVVSGAWGIAPPALAQEQVAAERSGGLDEIVVTATRREERLSDVPIAVSAISGDTLAQRQIVDVDSLQRIAPGLVAAPFGDATSPMLAIRGQISQDIVAAIDPAVGVYVDGVYLGRSTGANLSFIDVDRVEVLRGPQGTLFGRNTIGGAISITPTHPTDEWEGRVSAKYGNFNHFELTGVVNVPLTEGLAARFVASHNQRDGFARSSLTGAELNAQNIEYLRGSISADLGPDWNLLISGDFTHSRSAGQWFTLLAANPTGELVARIASGGRETLAQYINRYDRNPAVDTRGPFITRNWGTSGIVTGNVGSATVKSITAYREVQRHLNNIDQDGSPFELLQIYKNDSLQYQFSQELQVYGKALEERLDWIVGGYYFTEEGSDTVAARFVYPLAAAYSITDATAYNRNFAVYGQLTYALTDQFALVGGVRYARDTRRLDLFSRNAAPTLDVVASCALPSAIKPRCEVGLPKKVFDYVPFTAGVNFKPTRDALIYAKWSRGFRSGGYNTRGTTEDTLLTFDPEKVDSFEIGTKFEINRTLRVSADVFQSNFDDIQLLSQVGSSVGTLVAINQNGGKARIRGLEAEAEAALGRLRLSGGLALTDYKYLKLAPNVIGIVKASPLTMTPKTTFSLAADYTLPTGFGALVLHGDYAYRSRTYFAPVPPSDPIQQQDGYGLFNATLTARVGDNLTLNAFGKNLTNKRYLLRTTGSPSLGYTSGYPGDPRTYGVGASFTF